MVYLQKVKVKLNVKAFGMYNSLFDDDDFNDSDNVSDALDDSDNNDFEYEEEYN